MNIEVNHTKDELSLIYKLNGIGNSFLFVWGPCFFKSTRAKVFQSERQLSQIAQLFCSSKFGLGADGFVVIWPGNSSMDFEWQFFNNDGSHAEMCGNAARCAGLFSRLVLKVVKSKLSFGVNKNILFTTQFFKFVSNSSTAILAVQMPTAKILGFKKFSIPLEKDKKIHHIHSGVPHAVCEVESGDLHTPKWQNKYRVTAEILRRHPFFGRRGTNVTFFKKIKKNKIQVITFERGVEGFTFACGTGAVAAALAHACSFPQKSVSVSMPGGMLKVDLMNNLIIPKKFDSTWFDSKLNLFDASLKGEATLVGKFEMSKQLNLNNYVGRIK